MNTWVYNFIGTLYSIHYHAHNELIHGTSLQITDNN